MEKNIKNIFILDRKQIFFTGLAHQIASLFSPKHNKKIILPINKNIRNKMSNKKLIIFNEKLCDLSWYFLIFLNLTKGLIFGSVFFIKNFFYIFEKNNFSKKIYFDFDFNKSDICNNITKNFFITKYISIKKNSKDYIFLINKKNKKFGLKKNIESFKDNQKNNFLIVNDIYPKLTLSNNFKFFFYFVTGFFYNIFLILFKKNWVSSFLFLEIVKAKIFYLAKNYEIADEYIIKYTKTIIKPLWTYAVEEKNKKIFLMMYSLNSFGHKMRYQSAHDPSANYLLDYTNYIVWDENHENILRNIFINKENLNFVKFGTILTKPAFSMKKYPSEKIVSVFDIVPLKEALNEVTEPSIIKSKYLIKFTEDLLEISKKIGFKIVIKPKKNLYDIKRYNKVYINKLKKIMLLEKNFIFHDDNNCIENLILSSNAVISYPYTSTANIAKNLNIPSVYYDPSNELDPTSNLHLKGIELIQDKNLLESWLNNNIKF